MADLRLAETRIIRTPAAGPEPCNTLAFLRCLVPGMDVGTGVDGETVRTVVSFQTEFRLDGYLQSQFEWYKANTLVSATASLKLLNTTTDLTFLLAVDKVEPELRQLDGGLAFHVTCAAMMQNDDIFPGQEEVVLTAALTAYVLCFEPRAERPPLGPPVDALAKSRRGGPPHLRPAAHDPAQQAPQANGPGRSVRLRLGSREVAVL